MADGERATFGALLRRLRKSASLTQEELAERAGLSRRGINDLERGARLTPRRDTAALLADALGLEGDERAAFLAAARHPDPRQDASAPSAPSAAPAATASLSSLPSGTVTLLFTDIEGSTKLLQRLGSEYARALGEHQALLRAAFAAHGGVEVDTQGDAFFVAFASAPEAVAAAAEATRALAAHPWPTGATLRVRMGLHTGTPQVVAGHYVGLDVHRAARIAAAGHGGQVLLSEATRALVEQGVPDGCALRDLGAHRLKDLQLPEHITQLVLANSPGDFPPLKTLDTHRHNLPVQPTPLLGRQEQVAELTALFRRDDVRLATLTGSGGIGKTRLAVQVAAEVVEAFPDGVWFVRLSRLIDPRLVVPTIAQTLSLKELGGEPVAETLREHLADKRLLLVLDNFEQVVGAASEVAGLLEVSRGLKVLVTSRIPLHLRGEREYPLGPLPLPDPHQLPAPEGIFALLHYAAVTLFIERAQAAKPDFAVTAANAPTIAEICRRLDGLPLAIELAAVRARILPPEALLARLAAQLQVLTGGPRDAEERQQTMRATVAWSAALLTPAQQVLFRRLAVFVGGCTLEAAEAVCVAPASAEPLAIDLLDGLTDLVEQSLVQQREESGEPRFVLLHVIREYALERLEESDEAEALRRAHAGEMVALAERARLQQTGPETVAWRVQLEREHDNLRAALGWTLEVDDVETGLRLARALSWFWKRRGHLREGRTWLERLLAAGPPEAAAAEDAGTGLAALRAKALVNVGVLANIQGDYAAAEAHLERGRTLALAAGDRATVRIALSDLGLVAMHQGDLERAAARYAESLALAREQGNQQGITSVLINLGQVATQRGDPEQAAARTAEALALASQQGDRDRMALCLNNLGVAARRRGDLVRAEALLREALATYGELGDGVRCAMVMQSLAETASMAGRGERVARLLGAAAVLREALGAPLPAHSHAESEQIAAGARASLGEDAWAAAYAAGQAMTMEGAIAEALESEHPLLPHRRNARGDRSGER